MNRTITLAAAFALAVAPASVTQAQQDQPRTGQQTGQQPGQQGQDRESPPGRGLQAQGSQAAQRMDDRLFAMAAASSGMAEVGICQLATQKTEDESVRTFAERMIRDHTEANQKLMELARTKGVELPEGPDLTNAASAMALASCPPDSFNESFFKQQEAAHLLAVGLYKAQAEHGQDEELRQFAQETLPKLEEHLQMARQHSGSAGDRTQQPTGLQQQLSDEPQQGRGEAPPARPNDNPER